MFATKTRGKLSAAASSKQASEATLKRAPRRHFPSNLRPMLATLVNEPFSSADWTYEVKWDGW